MGLSRGKEVASVCFLLLSLFPSLAVSQTSWDPAPGPHLSFPNSWTVAQAAGEERESAWSCIRVDVDFIASFITCHPIVLINHLWTRCSTLCGAPYYTENLQFHNLRNLQLQYFRNTCQENKWFAERQWKWLARPPQYWRDLEIFLMGWDHFILDVSWGTYPLNDLLLSAHYAFSGISTSPAFIPRMSFHDSFPELAFSTLF